MPGCTKIIIIEIVQIPTNEKTYPDNWQIGKKQVNQYNHLKITSLNQINIISNVI